MTTASAESPPRAAAQPSPQSSDLISVVVVFWNGRDQVAPFFSAIEAAKKTLPYPLEVIAVDNASEDGTAAAIARQAPWTALVENAGNEGFAGGCNRGLEAARGQWLLLLNPDCEANAEALAGMVDYLKSHPSAGAVGPLLLHEDGLPQHSAHREPSWQSYWATHSLASPWIETLGKRLWKLGLRRRQPRAVGWLMGACLMVRRECRERVGDLHEAYFMYSEDADWCHRIRDAGWRTVFLPGLTLPHGGGVSAKKRREFTFRRLYRSLILYSRRHHSAGQNLALRISIALDLWLRLPIYRAQGDLDRLASTRAVLAMVRANDPELALEAEAPRPAKKPKRKR
ncbi:MAG: glycosyltransferase family 2 protein [Sumerlaeia bacterium]